MLTPPVVLVLNMSLYVFISAVVEMLLTVELWQDSGWRGYLAAVCCRPVGASLLFYKGQRTTQYVSRTQEEFLYDKPQARDLQILLVFFPHSKRFVMAINPTNLWSVSFVRGLSSLCGKGCSVVTLQPAIWRSSGDRASGYCAGGRRFKPQPDQHSGSLNNWGECAAFIMTPING